MSQTQTQKPENPFLNVLINVILPVAVLNKLSSRLGDNGAAWALLIALALPIGYGIYDYWKRRHRNFMSALGVISLVFTGGFALFELEGIWFSIKEAAFPAILGLAVLGSAFTARPFMYLMFWNPQALNLERIQAELQARNNNGLIMPLMQRCTYFMALSFALSSALNFVLAQRVFTEISLDLAPAQRSEILNQQIAQMTWLGFVVIAIPLLFVTGLIMWYFLKSLRALTGLKLEELLPHS